MRIVVTGGRLFDEADYIEHVLSLLRPTQIAFGDCPTGLDAIAWEWAKGRGLPWERFEASWTEEGRAAGPRRNGRMLREFKPDLVVAFPGGRGTIDCVRQATEMGLRVVCVGYEL
jgi:hypothetical protein